MLRPDSGRRPIGLFPELDLRAMRTRVAKLDSDLSPPLLESTALEHFETLRVERRAKQIEPALLVEPILG
jgi:hypothetical protein